MARSDELEPEELLPHLPWVRALARRLVGESACDDLVQEVLLAAVKHPPRARSMSAWLKTVVRRLAWNRYRDQQNRSAREVLAARDESQLDDDPFLEELELHSILVDAVRDLPANYRAVILLRYYHNQTSEEIADELGLSAVNVRSRLHRAVAQLRVRLDRRLGDRDSWRGAMALWLTASQLKLKSTAAASVATSATVEFWGGIAMKKTIAGVVTTLLLIGVVWWSWTPPDPVMSTNSPDSGAASWSRVALAPQPEIESAPTRHHTAAHEESKSTRLRVVDQFDGQPLPNAQALLLVGRMAPSESIVTRAADSEGNVSLPERIGSAKLLLIEAPGYVSNEIVLREGEPVPTVVGLVAGFELEGIVLRPDGTPASAGWVDVEPGLQISSRRGYEVSGNVRRSRSTRIDAEGRFRFAALTSIVGVSAWVPGYPPKRKAIVIPTVQSTHGVSKPGKPGVSETIVLQLETGHTLTGWVRNTSGRGIPNATIRTYSSGTDEPFRGWGPFRALTASDGSFQLRGLPIAVRQLHVAHSDYLPSDQYQWQWQSDADANAVEVVLESGAVVSGQLHVADAPIVETEFRFGGVRVETDEDGRFQVCVPPLIGDRVQINVVGVGSALVPVELDVANQDLGVISIDPGRSLTVQVSDAAEPVVQALVEVRTPCWIRPNRWPRIPKSDPLGQQATSADGAAMIGGLDAHDRVHVRVTVADRAPYCQSVELVELATTLHVSLSPPARLMGRTVDPDGNPVPGVRLRARPPAVDDPFGAQGHELSAVTDRLGRFLISSLPLAESLVLQVGAPGYPYLVVPIDPLEANEDRNVTITLEPGGVVSGHVRDSNGAPVAGARVSVANSRAQHDALQFNSVALSQDDGSYRLSGMARDAAPSVLVSAEGYVSARSEVQITEIGPTVQDFVLKPSVRFEGTLVDSKGQPWPRVDVRGGGSSGRTDESGRFELTQLDADAEVRLVVSANRFLHAIWSFESPRELPSKFVLDSGSLELQLEAAGVEALPSHATVTLERDRFSSSDKLPIRDGVVLAPQVGVGRFTLQVSVAGFPETDPVVIDVESGQAKRIALELLADVLPVTVRVVNAAGEPVSNAEMYWEIPLPGHDRQTKANSAGEAEFLIPWNPRQSLTVKAVGYAQQTLSWTDPGAEALGADHAIEVQLGRMSSVHLEVVDADGAPIERCSVRVERWGEGRESSSSILLDYPDHVTSGDFPLTGLEPGRYSVCFLGKSFPEIDRVTFDVRMGEHLELTHVLEPGISIRGTARIDGSPVPSRRLKFFRDGTNVATAHSDDFGVCEVNLPKARYRVELAANREDAFEGSLEIEIDVVGSEKVDFDFQTAPWSGVVTDAEGNSIPGARVSLVGGRSEVADAAGRFRFAQVGNHQQQVSVQADGYATRIESIVPQLRPTRIILAVGGAIRWVDPTDASSRHIFHVDRAGRPGPTIGFRSSIEQYYPLGLQTLWVGAPNRAWQRVVIDNSPERQVVEINLPPYGTLIIGGPLSASFSRVEIDPVGSIAIPDQVARRRIGPAVLERFHLPVGVYDITIAVDGRSTSQRVTIVSGATERLFSDR